MNDIDFKKIFLVSIFVILVVISMYLININNNKNIDSNNDQDQIVIVKNYSDFYTVDSCIYRYLTYLKGNKIDSILKVLDNEYINSNNITADNLFDFLTNYDGNNFSSKKMYEEKLSENIYNYYVFGYVEKEIMDSFPEKTESYFIVTIDKKNNLWKIRPYDGSLFR